MLRSTGYADASAGRHPLRNDEDIAFAADGLTVVTARGCPYVPASMASDRVVVFGLPPIWGTPSPSPFVIKLLTWLRMAKIDYEFHALRSPPRSKSSKMPYVDLPSGERIDESSRIILRLSAMHDIDLDRGLEDRKKATGRLLQATFEGHLYFAGLYERFATPEGWERTGHDYFGHLPSVVRAVAAPLVRRRTLKNLHGQGTGRLPVEEVRDLARLDIAAIATTLGEEPYFLGATPRTVDATAMGFLWAISQNPFASACREAVESHPNLVAFVKRMRDAYWADFTAS
jgi:glutathione S-transferase